MNFRNLIPLLSLTLLIFGSPNWAHAMGTGTVNGSEVAVRSEPNVKSEVLLQLSKGTKVEILDEKPGWLKIKVALDASFQFEGWVGSKFVTWKRPPTAKAPKLTPKAVTTPGQTAVVPTPVPTAPPPANPALDQFFETATSSKSTSAAAVAPSRASTVSQPSTPSFEAPTTRRAPQGTGFVENLTDRASVSLSAAYLLYHYSLDSAGTNIFAYNLPGVGFNLDLKYYFWDRNEGKLRAGSSLSYGHGLYRFNTNLQDTFGATFTTASTNASSNDINLKFLLDYRTKPGLRALAFGVWTGFEYFRFNGSDVQSDTGPINIFVSTTTMSVLAGAMAWIPLPGGKPFFGKVELDLLPVNFVSESPTDATGTDPKGSFGFRPALSVAWAPSERHEIDLGYRFRYQTLSFSGNASRVGTLNVTDGTVQNVAHELLLRYAFHF